MTKPTSAFAPVTGRPLDVITDDDLNRAFFKHCQHMVNSGQHTGTLEEYIEFFKDQNPELYAYSRAQCALAAATEDIGKPAPRPIKPINLRAVLLDMKKTILNDVIVAQHVAPVFHEDPVFPEAVRITVRMSDGTEIVVQRDQAYRDGLLQSCAVGRDSVSRTMIRGKRVAER